MNALPQLHSRTVLVVRSELLRYSETFVRQQVLSYVNWRPVLVGLERVAGLPTEDLRVRLLPSSRTIAARAYRKVLRSLQIPPPGIRRRLLGESPSLIHVHFGTDAVDHWDWIRAFDLPIVVTLHGYDINISRRWWKDPAQSPARRRYPGRLLQMAADPRVHFVAVSQAIARRASEWGIAPERISVRHIGVDTRSFRRTGPPLWERKPTVLFTGRLSEKKGVEYLIRAFAEVKKQLSSAELVIIGDGSLRQGLEQLAAQLNVPVSFLGAQGNDEVQRQLQRARVFCSPSVTAANGDAEGLPIVILEAQACGVPVVTSARGGAEEGIIDGVTGFAFREKEVDTLARHLLYLLRDGAAAERMGQAGRRHIASKFDLRRCTGELERLYDHLTLGYPQAIEAVG
ncbi:MAG: glycosyltransferase [Sinobacteraceae bacterium]|nr:glycosyltransferase [Nevskiaceae bacterium]